MTARHRLVATATIDALRQLDPAAECIDVDHAQIVRVGQLDVAVVTVGVRGAAERTGRRRLRDRPSAAGSRRGRPGRARRHQPQTGLRQLERLSFGKFRGRFRSRVSPSIFHTLARMTRRGVSWVSIALLALVMAGCGASADASDGTSNGKVEFDDDGGADDDHHGPAALQLRRLRPPAQAHQHRHRLRGDLPLAERILRTGCSRTIPTQPRPRGIYIAGTPIYESFVQRPRHLLEHGQTRLVEVEQPLEMTSRLGIDVSSFARVTKTCRCARLVDARRCDDPRDKPFATHFDWTASYCQATPQDGGASRSVDPTARS